MISREELLKDHMTEGVRSAFRILEIHGRVWRFLAAISICQGAICTVGLLLIADKATMVYGFLIEAFAVGTIVATRKLLIVYDHALRPMPSRERPADEESGG